MQIGSRDSERLLRGGPAKKARWPRKAALVLVLVVVLIVDLGLLSADLTIRRANLEKAGKRPERSNAMFRVPTLRTHGTSSVVRRFERAEL